MSAAVTVAFCLDLSQPANSQEVGKALSKVQEVLRELEPKTPGLTERHKYYFVLDLPEHTAVFAELVHLCEYWGLSYETRWFAGELT